jgi:hypothetical protein
MWNPFTGVLSAVATTRSMRIVFGRIGTYRTKEAKSSEPQRK